jgi:putative spermidine/putrescine transport system permease protein
VTSVAGPAVHQRRRSGRLSAYLHAHPNLRLGALLSAPLTWLVVLYLGSLAVMFVSAFWTVDSFTNQLQRTFTTDNFQQLLSTPVYRTVAVRTITVAATVTVIDAVLALPLAFFIAKVVQSRRARAALVVAVSMPLWAGYLVKGYAWRVMLDHHGVLDWALEPLGVTGPGLGIVATTIALAYLWLPFMILPIYAALDRLPSSLLDAAADLGAPAGLSFRTVVMPLIWPGVVAGSIFTFSLSLGDYIMVRIVGGKSQLFASIVYDNIGVAGNVPFAAAAAVFPVIVVVLYLVMVRRTGALDNL